MENSILPRLISVCIPAYEMNGRGHAFLKQSFDILATQTFTDFDVVVSDHSKNDFIEKLCKKYSDQLTITYLKNEYKRGSSSANVNNAIKNATGQLIKILFQDDFLYSRNSLQEIADNFNLTKDNWLITACEHTTDGNSFIRPFYPRYNNLIKFGKNTISSPSVLTIKNKNPLLFNEHLIWLMDCEYYARYYKKFGPPKILNKINVVNRIGSHQVSNTMVGKITKIKEFLYVLIIPSEFLRKSLYKLKSISHFIKLTRTKIINSLIQKNNYKSYLEIGVNTPDQPGYNWESVAVETKHGVDPTVNTTFKMTSDEFFANNHVSMKYDIIFVDGSHIFEQAYRDITNSLNNLNDGGTIVVHDCNPVKEVTQRRERASNKWHGDVWKAILKLRTENPDVSIYTIDADEGCVIIQKGFQELLKPEHTQENIYTYHYFNKHRKEILNLISAREFRKIMGMNTWFDRFINIFY